MSAYGYIHVVLRLLIIERLQGSMRSSSTVLYLCILFSPVLQYYHTQFSTFGSIKSTPFYSPSYYNLVTATMMILHPFCAVVAAVLTTSISPVAVGSSFDPLKNSHPKIHRKLQDDEIVIDVGNIRPEGTHALSAQDVAELGLDPSGSYMLVSEFFYGGIKVVNVENGDIVQAVPSAAFQERGGLGVSYGDGYFLSAGAGPILDLPFEVYIYDPSSGDLVGTCTPPDDVQDLGFFNDFEVDGSIAYVTDSTFARLWQFNISEAAAGNCEMMYQDLDEEVFLGTDDMPIRSNGEWVNEE